MCMVGLAVDRPDDIRQPLSTMSTRHMSTADSGEGARLGANESRVYGVGPILTYAFGKPRNPLTFIVKGFHEFGAERTFEGDIVDVAVSFKF